MIGSGAVELAASAGAGERNFLGTCALLFLASAWGTMRWCGSMPGGMPMPGGWTMSMAWMRMPGQSWLGAAVCFIGMWVVMMAAMMSPSLTPMLSRYRRAVGARGETSLGARTALVGAGYFLVWAAVGAIVYPLGVAVAAAVMRWPALARSVPTATGVVLLLAGCVQLTTWKARQLACCRGASDGERALAADLWSAWGHGLRLGKRCGQCCCGFMMILLATGVMDLGAMALVAASITFERLAPRPTRAARATGAIVILAGVLVMARAAGMA